MAIKIFLGLNAFVFIGYGIACLVSPAIVAEAAGLQPTTGDGTVELRAMYGGLQAAVGMLALAALLRAELQRPVLLVLAFLFFGLASARMIGALLAITTRRPKELARLWRVRMRLLAAIGVALLAAVATRDQWLAPAP